MELLFNCFFSNFVVYKFVFNIYSNKIHNCNTFSVRFTVDYDGALIFALSFSKYIMQHGAHDINTFRYLETVAFYFVHRGCIKMAQAVETRDAFGSVVCYRLL